MPDTPDTVPVGPESPTPVGTVHRTPVDAHAPPPAPDPDLARRLLDRLLAVQHLLGGDLERFLAETGLTQARVHLLWLLGEQGPATQRDLAAALGVSARNVTGLVDGLVASGHVTREPHPGDRRAFLVTPTTSGGRAIAALRDSHLDLARQLFAGVDEERLRVVDAVLDDVVARLAALVEEAR